MPAGRPPRAGKRWALNKDIAVVDKLVVPVLAIKAPTADSSDAVSFINQ